MTEPPATPRPPDDPYAAPGPGAPERPAPPYGAPYGVPSGVSPSGRPRNGLGTAALVLGIIALIGFWTVILGIVLGLLALVFGIIGRKRANRREATNGGVALAGAIIGAIALAGGIAIIAAGAAFFVNHKSDIQKYRDCLRSAQTSQQQQDCADQFGQDIRH